MDTRPPRSTRRTVVRLLGGGVLALALPAALRPQAGDAARGWCRTDPIFDIAGKTVHVSTSSDETAPTKVTGPTKVLLRLPEGVPAAFVWADDGFGRSYDVQIVPDSGLKLSPGKPIPIRVAVYVPAADGSLPVLAELVPQETGVKQDMANKVANTWLVLKGAI
jgi:hypothetical protein